MASDAQKTAIFTEKMKEKNIWENFYQKTKESKLPWGNKADGEVKEIVERIKPKSKILDLGCGNGKNSFYLEKKGFQVYGIDLSETAIKEAKDKTKNKKNFIVGNALKLPYKDDFFDAILDIGCYHSIKYKDREKYLSEVDRVLKKDGKLFLRCFSDKNSEYVGVYSSSKYELNDLFSKKFDFLSLKDIKFEDKNGFFSELIKKQKNKVDVTDFSELKIPENIEKALHIRDFSYLEKMMKFVLPTNFGMPKTANVPFFSINNEKTLKNFSRIYFGDEFCQRLLPTEQELLKILDFCKKNKKEFTLVTPFLTDVYLKQYENLVKIVNKEFPEAEIVINDFGLLNSVSKIKNNKLKFVLGRLLVEQKRDSRTIDLKNKIPRKGQDYFKRLNIENEILQEFLLKNNIERVELDNVLQGIKLKLNKLKASLYLPFVYTTTTRLCMTANCDWIAGRNEMKIDNCNKECLKYTFLLKNPTIPKEMILKGNTQFFINEKLPENLEKINVDRIVYSYL